MGTRSELPVYHDLGETMVYLALGLCDCLQWHVAELELDFRAYQDITIVTS